MFHPETRRNRSDMNAKLKYIYRYPVKGLQGELLDHVQLQQNTCLPQDRRFAISLNPSPGNGNGTGNSEPVDWQAPETLASPASHEKLAQLGLVWDEASHMLTLYRRRRQVLRADLSCALGRTLVDQFLDAFLGGNGMASGRMPRRHPVKLIEAREGVSFSDSPEPGLTLVNLASLRLVKRMIGESLDPQRFRANLYVDGVNAWEEMDLPGQVISVGGQDFEVLGTVARDSAINVCPPGNPEAGRTTLNLCRVLDSCLGQQVFGVRLRPLTGGLLQTDEPAVPSVAA